MKKDSVPHILGHGASVPHPNRYLLDPSVCMQIMAELKTMNGHLEKIEASLSTITCVDHDAFTQFIRQEAAADRLSLLDRR